MAEEQPTDNVNEPDYIGPAPPEEPPRKKLKSQYPYPKTIFRSPFMLNFVRLFVFQYSPMKISTSRTYPPPSAMRGASCIGISSLT